jgi:putative SbcD/Mre11-related phosphoesterase
LIHLEARVAVVADVHLGYEWSRGSGGDVVPEHSLGETVARLARLLDRAPDGVDRLIVAGDLVERPALLCARTRRDVEGLRGWLGARGVALQAVRGNHDGLGPGFEASIEVAGWTIVHGDRPVEALGTCPLITGHVHPVLRVAGVTAPCFAVRPDRIVLPAFSPNAAGWNVALGTLADVDLEGLRCVASAGDGLLDFGLIAELPGRLGDGPAAVEARGVRRTR